MNVADTSYSLEHYHNIHDNHHLSIEETTQLVCRARKAVDARQVRAGGVYLLDMQDKKNLQKVLAKAKGKLWQTSSKGKFVVIAG